jgi:hypothetical protein
MPKQIYNAKTLENLPEDAKKVDMFKDKILGRLYYVYDDKLYKRMKDGKYREVCPQSNRKDNYTFYFLKNKDGGKSRIGTKRINEMSFSLDL